MSIVRQVNAKLAHVPPTKLAAKTTKPKKLAKVTAQDGTRPKLVAQVSIARMVPAWPVYVPQARPAVRRTKSNNAKAPAMDGWIILHAMPDNIAKMGFVKRVLVYQEPNTATLQAKWKPVPPIAKDMVLQPIATQVSIVWRAYVRCVRVFQVPPDAMATK